MPTFPANWRTVFLVAMAACALLYLFNSSRERSDDERSAAALISSKPEGWDQLVICTPASSFDNKKTLILRRDNTALIREKIQGAEPQKLTWAYDAETKQLSIDGDGGGVFTVIDGVSGSPCMLISGALNRADLRRSWFADELEASERD
jgi:hypothetical protein